MRWRAVCQAPTRAMAEAQAAGKVDATLPPAELLAVVLSIVEAVDDAEPAAVAVRRKSVSAAVRRLVTPVAHGRAEKPRRAASRSGR